jgi:hypothetical protein
MTEAMAMSTTSRLLAAVMMSIRIIAMVVRPRHVVAWSLQHQQ